MMMKNRPNAYKAKVITFHISLPCIVILLTLYGFEIISSRILYLLSFILVVINFFLLNKVFLIIQKGTKDSLLSKLIWKIHKIIWKDEVTP